MNTTFDAEKEAGAIDRIVGERIRRARILRGLTQDGLAEKLQLSYQQIQKYETGANRVSAGRLAQIASFLGEPITFFFEGSPVSELPHGGADRSTIEMVRRFEKLDPTLRSVVGALLKVLAEGRFEKIEPEDF